MPKARIVNQYDLDGNFVKQWASMMDIRREKGFFVSAISSCCRKKVKTAYGYIWRYAEESELMEDK